MPRRIVDLSVPLEMEIASDPPPMLPKIGKAQGMPVDGLKRHLPWVTGGNDFDVTY